MKKILIVDDDDNMREAVKETILRMNVAEVVTAVSGREGYAKATSDIFDLIISDIRMPDIDGISMLEMLKVTGIDIPICFITAFGSVSGAVDALKLGAYDYILKPFPPEVVEELVLRTFELKKLGKAPTSQKKRAIYKSAYMAHLFSIAREVAQSDATILITGESGTGKEVLARFIYENSKRSAAPFIAVNCAAIPDTLLESELFGYEKGAFTGASGRKLGKFEMAAGGVLLLDELGEIPLHLQPKLLRVIQEKEVERLGGEKPKKVDVRILATTNRDLKDMVTEGSFREDLFYRLNVISLELPPLRERKEDLPELVNFFVEKYSETNHRPLKAVSEEALDALKAFDWPGNVRELEHTIERAVVLSKGREITAADLFLHGITVKSFQERNLPLSENPDTGAESVKKSSGDNPSISTIADMERELILKTLKQVSYNRTRAAELLGITVRTLRNKINEYRAAGISIEEG
ncbi:MAG: sigma-54 dependent transcriptional regulator [Deferribacteraceae bacterium]|jgi:two-component system response regulator FlrC|nr:sigma-54 dependent transcriptional regulator [Deferribacteraceae bacterium]